MVVKISIAMQLICNAIAMQISIAMQLLCNAVLTEIASYSEINFNLDKLLFLFQ